jgi:hypothetical protein
MPPFSFHRPRFSLFRRSRRSHSPTLPLARPDDETTASHSAYHAQSLPLSSRLSSRPDAPEQDVLAAIGTSGPSSPGNTNQPPNYTGRLCVDGPLSDFCGQPAKAARTVAQTNVVESNSPPMRSSVAQEPAHLPCLLIPAGDTQPRRSLVQQHSPCLLTAPSQHSLDPQRPTVSVFPLISMANKEAELTRSNIQTSTYHNRNIRSKAC